MSYVILWLLWEKFFLSFSFFSPSQTTDLLGYFRWGNADCLLLISVRCRHFNSARVRARERSIYDRQWEKERKRKNIIVTANPIISLMYVCVDWHVKVFSFYQHTNRTNQQTKKMLSKRARVCNKKKPIETVSFLRFFFFLAFSYCRRTNTK